MINGLKKLLIPLMKHVTPSLDLAGLTLGLDLSGWIYCIGTRSNSIFEVIEDAIYDTFLDELLASLERLLNYFNLIVVLDGDPLPQKQETAELRKRKTEQALQEYKSLLRHSDDDHPDLIKLARRCFTRTANLQNAIIDRLSNLKSKMPQKFDFLIAPYEADAQLAFMNRENLIDAILSMDADLVLFGSKKIIFPASRGMHDVESPCLLYESEKLFCPILRQTIGGNPKLLNFIDIAQLLGMTGLGLLGVCTNHSDYQPRSIGGLVTALKAVYNMTKSPHATERSELTDDCGNPEMITNFLSDFIAKGPQLAQEIGLEKFQFSLSGFLGHVVYDPRCTKRRMLLLSFHLPAGTIIDDESAQVHAVGRTSPNVATGARLFALEKGANVLRSIALGEILPSFIIPLMIEGSSLPKQQTLWTEETMKKFLLLFGFKFQKKNMPTRLQLIRACESQIKNNDDRLSKGLPLILHSPFGWSLRDFYEAAGIFYEARGHIFQEQHLIIQHSAPKFTVSYSMKLNSELLTRSLIPTIDEDVIEKWFELDGCVSTLALVKGWKIFADFPTILQSLQIQRRIVDPSDRFSQRIDGNGAEIPWSADTRRVCRACSKSPATMKAVKYEPSCIFLLETDNEAPIVLKIMDAACSCKAGDSKRCPHIAALLFAIQNGRKDVEIEKSKAWKIPRSRTPVDVSLPVSRLVFSKQDLYKAKTETPTKRQRTLKHSIHSTQEQRGTWDKWVTHFSTVLDPIQLQDQRQKFFELVRSHKEPG